MRDSLVMDFLNNSPEAPGSSPLLAENFSCNNHYLGSLGFNTTTVVPYTNYIYINAKITRINAFASHGRPRLTSEIFFIRSREYILKFIDEFDDVRKKKKNLTELNLT